MNLSKVFKSMNISKIFKSMNISKIFKSINTIGENKYLYGVAMIILNLGSRYIEIDFSASHKAILSSKFFKFILIFTICFIATKDIIVSIILTFLFVLFIMNLFHEKSSLCVIPNYLKKLDLNNDGVISDDEIKAYHLLKKHKKNLKKKE